ncbi:MAG: tyrosine-type recombinase/integrase [Myxococcales bacterium]
MTKRTGIQVRHRKLWVRLKTPEKGWRWIRALSLDGTRGLELGEEDHAAKFRERAQAILDAGEELGLAGDFTVAGYSKRRFIPYQEQRIRTWEDDEDRLRLWVLPKIGAMQVAEVQPRHVNDVIQAVRAAKKAPRTVRNIYAAMQGLFRLSRLDGLRADTPCILSKAELGKIADKHREWRAGAIFTREELQTLISSDRVPRDRRMYYAAAALGMLRPGEVAGLRWRHLVKLEPLGRLVIATSYDTGTTKTGVERWMPVHPVLAAMLAEWKLAGWPAEFGRKPEPNDVIIPTPKPTNRGPRVAAGVVRDEHFSYKRLLKDLTALGLRRRRVHDFRRSGITLAREDGAERDVLRLCTHQPPADVMELYTSFGWAKLCAQISCIRVERVSQVMSQVSGRAE